MANSVSRSSRDLLRLLRKNKWKRGTISADYFRELVDRNRVEKSFLERLNKYCVEYHSFSVVKVDAFVKSPYSRHPGEGRGPEPLDLTGFRPSPE